jgi:hypothetical protein
LYVEYIDLWKKTSSKYSTLLTLKKNIGNISTYTSNISTGTNPRTAEADKEAMYR